MAHKHLGQDHSANDWSNWSGQSKTRTTYQTQLEIPQSLGRNQTVQTSFRSGTATWNTRSSRKLGGHTTRASTSRENHSWYQGSCSTMGHADTCGAQTWWRRGWSTTSERWSHTRSTLQVTRSL